MADRPGDSWNPGLYDGRHSFVHRLATGVLDLLAPRPGERILDLGCGTGALTKRIAESGARVVGIDASAAMIGEARRRFPELDLAVLDAREMRFDIPFDAIFSNATLHWVRPPDAAAARMRDALRPGGRLAAEFGGRGNVARLLAAAEAAGRSLGLDLGAALHGNYFPTPSEYATVLESAGFVDVRAELFDRPTPLEGAHGLRDWVRMFRPEALERLPAGGQDPFFDALETAARPELFREGAWHADYRRLRVLAIRA